MNIPAISHRIDAHVHFWNPETRSYPWMPAELARPIQPADLEPLLHAKSLDAAVLVQTVSEIEETREFLRIAGEHPFIAGVVGWVDLTDHQIAHTLQDLMNGENGQYLVGIRHQVHDEESEDWLLQESVQVSLDVLAERNLVYDLLVRTRELPAAITTVRDFPHLRFVVDHIAKPPIASGELEPWASLMNEFAGLPNVTCKLSGMVTEAGADWTVDHLLPYISQVVDTFGPERLLWGSDWPVCTLVTDYARVYDAAREALDRLGVLTAEHEAAIFGDNAWYWYGLDRAMESGARDDD